MGRLPAQPHAGPEASIGDLVRRVGDLERVVQQLEGCVSPFDGSGQPGMFAGGSIGGADVGAGQLTGAHMSQLSIAGILASSGTQLLGSTYLGSGAELILASGVSQPVTAPGLALTSGTGLLLSGTTYYVSYSWYDGTHETTCYAPASAIKIGATGGLSGIAVTLPIAPVGATQANIYMDTSAFGVGAGKLQTAVAVSTTTTTTVTITAFASGGAASPAVSSTGFASQTAALVPAQPVDSNGSPYGWLLEGNGRLRFLGPTIQNQFWVYDEFVYASGAYGASGSATGPWLLGFSGTGATVGIGTSTSTNPGTAQLAAGTTTTGNARLRTNTAFALGAARIRCSFSVQFDPAGLPNGTQSYNVLLGLSTNTAPAAGIAVTDKAIGFQFTSDSLTTLVLKCANGTASSTATSTVAIVAGNWYFLEFEVDAGRTAINWWVNETKQTPITTNIPATNDSPMALILALFKTLGTTSRLLNIDTAALYGDYVSG